MWLDSQHYLQSLSSDIRGVLTCASRHRFLVAWPAWKAVTTAPSALVHPPFKAIRRKNTNPVCCWKLLLDIVWWDQERASSQTSRLRVLEENLRENVGDLLRNAPLGASLVTQWLRLCLPVRGPRVQSLIREDPTCHGATKSVCHNYWACVLESGSHNYWSLHARSPCSAMREATAMRSFCTTREWPLVSAAREKAASSSEDPAQAK